ncbi:MAG TPA: FAD-dependent monooxygenase [Longimicrobiales bacterium]
MRVNVIGGGPGGLYAAILLKRADPGHEVVVLERNRANDPFGFGVVFSDATGHTLAEADPATFAAMERRFARWDDIDIHYGETVVSSTGHGFSGLSRRALLEILTDRARELGVDVRFGCDVADPATLAEADLIIAADGANSAARDRFRDRFLPTVDVRPNRFVWLGTTRPFPAFTFFFKWDAHGLWRVHAYQYEDGHSTFIVETTEATWRTAGLERADEAATLAFCEALFADELDGHRLLGNRSIWRRFATVRNERWSHAVETTAGRRTPLVLLGDAAHTAHFSIGSGTKLAMEDAIALVAALRAEPDVPRALEAYEAERRPAVESLQRAAQVSLEWFEGTERFWGTEPIQFAFNLLTRSLRVTHDNLKVRDPAFVAAVDAWFAEQAERQLRIAAATDAPADAPAPAGPAPVAVPAGTRGAAAPTIAVPAGGEAAAAPGAAGAAPAPAGRAPGRAAAAPAQRAAPAGAAGAPAPQGRPRPEGPLPAAAPPPLFTPYRARDLILRNRVVVSPMCQYSATDGTVDDWHLVHLGSRAIGGAGLVMAEMTDVSPDGRITHGCAGLYRPEHVPAWKRIVDFVHAHTDAKIGIQLGHAGRKAATARPWERGDNEPLRPDEGAWPILAPSPIPYLPHGQVPREMERSDMDRVLQDFVRAAHMAEEAGFDWLELHCAHGYLLGTFISPLTNVRTDEYGGPLENRMRFPLEVFDAVRAVWPAHKPMSVRISAMDWAPGGMDSDEAVHVARLLKAHGCDIVDVSAGQTVAHQRPRYGRQFQTPFADRIRHEAGIPTMAVGNISSYTDVNTILAAGRADLCLMARAHLWDPYWTRHAAHALGYEMPWPPQYATLARYNPRFE